MAQPKKERNFYVDVNINQNELKQAVIHKVDAFPPTPVEGQIVFLTVKSASPLFPSNTLCMFEGGGWHRVNVDWDDLEVSPANGPLSLGFSGDAGSGMYYRQIKFSAQKITHEELNNNNNTLPKDNPHEVGIKQAVEQNNDLDGNVITGSAAPQNDSDLANKKYVDSKGTKIKWGNPVQVATTSSINISATNAGATIDGYTLVTKDRILVKSQAAGDAKHAENGIYDVKASGGLVRADDANTNPELDNYACICEGGATNKNKTFIQTETLSVTATPIEPNKWVVMASGGTSYKAGHAIEIVNGFINVLANKGVAILSNKLQVKASEVADANGGLIASSTNADEYKIKVNIDNASIGIDATSKKVEVKNAGILAKHISTDVPGVGLGGGSTPTVSAKLHVQAYNGSDLALAKVDVSDKGVAVKIDNTTIKRDNDGVLSVATTGTGLVGKYAKSIDLTAGVNLEIAHGLASNDVTVSVYKLSGTTRELVDVYVEVPDTNKVILVSNTDLTGCRVVIIG